MEILNKNWLTQDPFDYELKRYKLLGAIKRIQAMIEAGHLYSSLLEVESHLDDLYKLKHGKDAIDDRLKVLKGINLDTMSLEYEYPKDAEPIMMLYQLCDIAIEYFEEIFKLIRNKWRLHSKKINLTEIPSTRPNRKKGYVFLINKMDKDNNILTYSYNKSASASINSEWKDLNLNLIDVKISNVHDMGNYIESIDKIDSENRFWRCDHSLEYDHEDCILPLLKYNLFYKIAVS